MSTAAVFIITLLLSAGATAGIRHLAWRCHIIDTPDGERKIHGRAVPLLGGVAIFVSFFAGLFFAQDAVLARGLTETNLWVFFAGALVLLTGGVLDDVFDLKPRWQIIFPVVAALLVIYGGISIVKVTNPFGGLVHFGALASAGLTFVWILGMIYTTKLLDGADGLVSGLGVISGVIIFLFTMTTRYYQPDIGLMALLFAAACLGFLFFNFYPAKIFLGESGSVLVGYIIAVFILLLKLRCFSRLSASRSRTISSFPDRSPARMRAV